jgi:hypothetical protein
MNVTAFEAVVENGSIVLPMGMRLPDQLKVYVLIPDTRVDIEPRPVAGIGSPRFTDPDQAKAFRKEVSELLECGGDDGGVNGVTIKSFLK